MEDIYCRGELYGALLKAADGVNPEEYPQMCEVFGNVIAEDADIEEIDYVKVADAFSECDHGKVIPKGVADFIEEVYEIAIGEDDGRSANNLGSMYYLGRFGFSSSGVMNHLRHGLWLFINARNTCAVSVEPAAIHTVRINSQ